MSAFDVEPEDMTRASVVDEKLNALLGGRNPAEGDELASQLSWLIEQVNDAFPLAVMPEQVEDAHLARMMEVAGESPVLVTAPLAPVYASRFDRLRAGLSRKVAAATLTFTAAFGGAAYAGVLPAPIQEAVSNAAAIVGLELPNPADAVADQDDSELEEVGNDDRSSDDSVGSGSRGARSGSGADSDDELESKGDDSDQIGDEDRDTGDDPSDGDSEQEDGDSGDEPDTDEPDSDEPDRGDESDTDEPDSGDESDTDEPDTDEPDTDEPDTDEPDSRDDDVDNEDGLEGSSDSGFGFDDEGALDL